MSKASQAPNKEIKYPYESRFGSHKSMVVHAPTDNPTMVICKDEFGEYTTYRNRLDNGSADPERYRESRLDKLFSGKVGK